MTISLNGSTGEDLEAVAAGRGVSLTKLLGQGIAHVLRHCEPVVEVVVVTEQQHNHIVRLIRAEFDIEVIAEWVHVAVAAVEAIRKELS